MAQRMVKFSDDQDDPSRNGMMKFWCGAIRIGTAERLG